MCVLVCMPILAIILLEASAKVNYTKREEIKMGKKVVVITASPRKNTKQFCHDAGIY